MTLQQRTEPHNQLDDHAGSWPSVVSRTALHVPDLFTASPDPDRLLYSIYSTYGAGTRPHVLMC
jgi:hypothetical protein